MINNIYIEIFYVDIFPNVNDTCVTCMLKVVQAQIGHVPSGGAI